MIYLERNVPIFRELLECFVRCLGKCCHILRNDAASLWEMLISLERCCHALGNYANLGNMLQCLG